MVVGIKFCGGCNSKYDRTRAFNNMKSKLGNYEFKYINNEETFDYVVVICGCHVMCASHADIKYNKDKFVIQSDLDAQKIIDYLKYL
ncbi:hypothetical protein [Fusobacterium sp. PH5-44]|uniref:hypothetical protein n=1 Tax=unclassified Fusobacterium TaxID=2648384 RepID=UPI003D26220A